MQTMKTLLLKGLAGSASGSNSNLKKSTLTAILTLITRPSLTEKHLSAMILHIFSVPGLVHHCGPDLCKKLIFKNGIFGQIIGKNFLNDYVLLLLKYFSSIAAVKIGKKSVFNHLLTND